MQILLLILALLLSACGGSEPPIKPAEASERPPLVLAFGDSITAGYMPVSGVLQLRQDLSYLSQLRGSGVVVTAAVGGATSEHGLKAQAQWLKGLPADHVIVMFGINDAVQGVSAQATAANIGGIFAAYPGAKRVVMSPPLWSAETKARQKELNDLLKVQAIIWGAQYIDLYTPSEDLRPWCAADRHPCADWHEAAGKAVAAAIKAGGAA